MSYTYITYVSALAELMVVDSADANFQNILPSIIQYAELRIYRDLDLLDTSTRDDSATLTAGNRDFDLPSANGTFIVTDEINVITPVSATTANGGTRNQLVPASDEMFNALWPSVSGSTIPQYFAMINQDTIMVAPWPDQSYRIEVVGTVRPPALTSSNTTTVLTEFFPDIFICASMVFAAGYQKNYGAQADDPRQSVSWETQYQTLLTSAKTEEARKTFTSQGYSDKSPVPTSTMPPRS